MELGTSCLPSRALGFRRPLACPCAVPPADMLEAMQHTAAEMPAELKDVHRQGRWGKRGSRGCCQQEAVWGGQKGCWVRALSDGLPQASGDPRSGTEEALPTNWGCLVEPASGMGQCSSPLLSGVQAACDAGGAAGQDAGGWGACRGGAPVAPPSEAPALPTVSHIPGRVSTCLLCSPASACECLARHSQAILHVAVQADPDHTLAEVLPMQQQLDEIDAERWVVSARHLPAR